MEKEYVDELSSEAWENSSWIARGTIPSLPSVPSCNQLYLHLLKLLQKAEWTCHKFSPNLFRTSTNQPLCRFFLSQSGHKRECRHCARQVQIWGSVLLLEKHPLHGPHWNESYCQKANYKWLSKKLPCVDSWQNTLSTLNSFLIPTDLTAIFSCSKVTGDLAFKLFVWTCGRTRQKTLILPECCPSSEAQIVGNSSTNNCYPELKTVPFRSMSLSSASRLLLSRCRCLDRRVEISSETNMGIAD